MWLNTYCWVRGGFKDSEECERKEEWKLKNDIGQEDEEEGPFRFSGNLINLSPHSTSLFR